MITERRLKVIRINNIKYIEAENEEENDDEQAKDEEKSDRKTYDYLIKNITGITEGKSERATEIENYGECKFCNMNCLPRLAHTHTTATMDIEIIYFGLQRKRALK